MAIRSQTDRSIDPGQAEQDQAHDRSHKTAGFVLSLRIHVAHLGMTIPHARLGGKFLVPDPPTSLQWSASNSKDIIWLHRNEEPPDPSSKSRRRAPTGGLQVNGFDSETGPEAFVGDSDGVAASPGVWFSGRIGLDTESQNKSF